MVDDPKPDNFGPIQLDVKDVSGKREAAELSISAERRQNINLRYYGFYLAPAIIVLTVIMEIVILNCILMQGGDVHVAVALAPIASFTTITIALLVGVFRGFRSKDTDNVPWGTVTEGVVGVS